MKADHKKILSFIRAVRTSFPDATIIFTWGGCYGFYKILKNLFPSAQAYMTDDENHIVTKINGKFYDIEGEYTGIDGKLRTKVVRLKKGQHDYWESVALRVEGMIGKYTRDTRKGT